ncbi:MAG: hypothetical protein KDC71_23285, partial [Acidobacteria bacterium]|nr:hypothetical protein [Acidobacteriota bacterium]
TVAIQDQRLIWVSSGDSPLWLWRDQKIEPINILHHGMYLGPPENIQAKVAEELLGNAAKTFENDQLIAFLLVLTHFSFYVTHKSLSQEKAETLFTMMGQQLGAPLPFSLDELMKPWHPAHLLCAHQLPIWGSLNLMPGDRILLASDGLEEGVSGITKRQLTEILGLEKSMPEITKELLKQVLRKGGFDNCTLWLRGI